MSSYAEPELDLYPDRVDVPLPLDEAPVESAPVDEVDRLRTALAEALAYVEACRPVPGNRVRAWRELVPAAIDRSVRPFDRALEGTLRAAAKWTPDEVKKVDEAIRLVADEWRLATPPEFTADDVWDELGAGFPVTKGLTGRLIAARNAGLIASTGRTIISTRQGEHGHGQRLTVWRAL